ncbi:unnamed protein product [Paramecium primaurelia]|uniref:Cilia-and flagella-associated protein 96 n=1 Tax=Paramecium primaurelia TaxID=5886 RepID=A0A8S1KCJ1_PARPR|nr:unnamed protein product [Paramecium primaurelia]
MSTQYRVPSNDNYIRDLENISQRERHGLFNQPPPLLLGDQYNDALKSQGKEKGILINKKLQKKHEPALFSEPGYTTLNDPYKDSFKAKQIYDKEKELAIKNPNSFKPNDHQKSVKHSEFEHMKEYNDKIYKTRNSAGNVITQARNFLTNPAKKGLGRTTINNLFSQIEYIPDPYDRQEEMDRQERIQHKSKQLPGTTRFITTSHGNRPFTSDGILLDGAGYTIQKKPPLYKGNPFRPSNQNKKGFQGTFEVLQYMEEGGPDIKTKQNTFEKLSATQTFEKPWRPNSNGTFARPCPSVSQQIRNRSAGSNQRV